MDRELEKFNEYVKNYDITDPMISYKYKHSIRVMNIAKSIAISEKFDDEDIYLATLAGLLHDIGRFYQAKYYHTFIDQESIDHGDEGYRILDEGLIDEFVSRGVEAQIIMISTRNHNKKEIEDNLDARTERICRLVRDADKLDILEKQVLKSDNNIIKKEILEEIYSKNIVNNYHCNTETDRILRMISWVFDFNYSYTFKYIKKNKIIDTKLELLGNSDEVKKLKEFILNEIEKRCNNVKY